jgi:hypothetical protein
MKNMTLWKMLGGLGSQRGVHSRFFGDILSKPAPQQLCIPQRPGHALAIGWVALVVIAVRAYGRQALGCS